MQDVAVAVLRTPVLLQCLQELATVDRHEFKTLSNEGFVWTNRHHVDMGNWRYTVLYQFLIVLAGHHRMQTVVNAFNVLVAKYPSLSRKHPPTKESLGMKGDVLEYCLHYCRFTGPAVEPTVVIHRLEFNEIMRPFEACVDALLHIIIDDKDGRPVSRYELPNPCMFVDAIFCAHGRLVSKRPDELARFEYGFSALVQSLKASLEHSF